MEMWELKLSQKEKTNSSFLSLSVSASGPVASSCAVLWDALGCPRFGVLISTRGATPRRGLARLSRPQRLKTTGGDFTLFFPEEGSGRFAGWPPFLFRPSPSLALLLGPLGSELVVWFWLGGALITHQPCTFLSSSLVYFHIFLWRQFQANWQSELTKFHI